MKRRYIITFLAVATFILISCAFYQDDVVQEKQSIVYMDDYVVETTNIRRLSVSNNNTGEECTASKKWYT